MPCGRSKRPPTPEEELNIPLPPWELSDEAWALLKEIDPEGFEAAQELYRLYKEHQNDNSKQ